MSDNEYVEAPRIITIASPKGGAGKTMATILLAAEFAAMGEPVLILDTDIQGSASAWHATSRRAQFPLHNIRVEHIIDKQAVQDRLVALSRVDEALRVVLVDVPGTAEGTLGTAIIYADLVVIPTRTHKFDVDQAVRLCRYVDGAGGRGRAIPYRLLLNAVDAIERYSAAYKAAILLLDNVPRFRTELSRRPTFASAATAGSLYEVASPTKAVLDARAQTRALVTELIEFINAVEDAAA